MAKDQDSGSGRNKGQAGGSAEGRALIVAALAGDREGLKALVAKGAPVDYADPDRGFTPLIIAVTRKDMAMAELLLGLGADPAKGFRQPITEEDKEMIRSLRKMREEDPEWKPQGDTLRNEEGILSGKITEIDVSPLGIARRKHDQGMIDLLKRYGAKD